MRVLRRIQPVHAVSLKNIRYATTQTQSHKQKTVEQRELHPESIACGNEPKLLYLHGQPPTTKTKFREFHQLCDQWKLLRTHELGNLVGSRSYILRGPLAELEQAIIRFTIDNVLRTGKGFKVISVPDLLYSNVIEGCGMDTKGKRTQVYSLQQSEDERDENISDSKKPMICLSGTAEMALGGYLSNKILPEDQLPLRFISVSRCYRAEVSTVQEESGIFRVHNFTKVEMFGVTRNDDEQSQQLHDEFRGIQENLFAQCDLHYRTLEMPASDLGVAAYRKYDIEAWMPGRQLFGEISSTSNCRDYQARQLNIRYQPTDKNEPSQYVHTVNGTGAAIPRMLIALLETSQQERGSIKLPGVLDPVYINWKESLAKCPVYGFNVLRNPANVGL